MRGKFLEWTFRICVIAPFVLPGWLVTKFVSPAYIAAADYLHDVARWLGGRNPGHYERLKKQHNGYNAGAGKDWLDVYW
jgi:hypothetical protein